MDKGELLQLVASIYAALSGVSDYQVPEENPEIHVLPKAVLHDLICNAPCHIQAVYHPDFGLMVSEELDIKNRLYDRSVVFHELVHHAQHINARFNEYKTPCERRAAAETEAYVIQNRYLAAIGGTQPVPVLNWFRLCEKQQIREAGTTVSFE
jgi:hypothetical protein